MTFVALFVAATKLAGAIVTLTVAANAFSFSRFRRKNLRPFRSPIHESSDVLAVFNVDEETNGFFFGLATAPAHVEDRLNDAWIQFAEEQKPYVDSQEVKQADALMGSATGDGGSHLAASSQHHDEYAVKKRKKTLKVAMEAMIRGFEKYSEEDEEEAPAAVPKEAQQPNVTAWHNVPHP